MVDKIRISYDDLKSPKVDETLARQAEEAALRIGARTASEEMKKVSLIHKSWFNLMIAGLIGALIAWALIEPYFEDTEVNEQKTVVFGLLLFLSVGGLAGLMIGSMEGILARNFRRAVKAGLAGLAIGFGGGLISILLAGIVAEIIIPIGVGIIGMEAAMNPARHFSGFILNVIIRSLLWAVVCMAVGLGPGIGIKSKKYALNGFLGGIIGGAIGGMLFDPINYFISGGTFEKGGEISRAIGLGVVGATAGLMIGLVETLTKDAWLLMTEGHLKGKQFIVYKNPTVIGSSPKCEVYLFKDPSIEPMHAAIHTIRDGYEIEDLNSPSGTLVNGRKIKRQRLINGDIIQIGETKFIYLEKEKKAGYTKLNGSNL